MPSALQLASKATVSSSLDLRDSSCSQLVLNSVRVQVSLVSGSTSDSTWLRDFAVSTGRSAVACMEKTSYAYIQQGCTQEHSALMYT